MGCCQRLSRCYILVTNTLFAIFGAALIAFGVLGAQHRIESSILIPVNILKMINILGIMICFTAVIGILGGFFPERQAIHILYTVVVLITLIYQIVVAVIVYDQAAHTQSWLHHAWAEATQEYRYYAQEKFSCCGFSHPRDHPVATATCQPDDIVNSAPACFHPMTYFVKHNLKIMYIVLFAALSIQILALCNAITMLCARFSGSADDDNDESGLVTQSGRKGRWQPSSSGKPTAAPPPNESIPLETLPYAPQQRKNSKTQQYIMIDSAISGKDAEDDTPPPSYHRQY
ncbi:hypothetical protein LRAMOSA08633 [Lichtheimia ramosa]|uniref:Tetraspanin n=1 Tax=Lichtheimia ramosa TaxID=688394 RepID=A0A077WFB4_9FUNG|nr:hypothetical protein LRAMOSA08633 [Lichtheimia ramosa]